MRRGLQPLSLPRLPLLGKTTGEVCLTVTLYFKHHHEHVCVITNVNVYLSAEISHAWNSLNQTKAAVSIFDHVSGFGLLMMPK